MTETDRRVERTRQAIRLAFLKLLFERGFGKLTIAAVIAEANVGRSTFYEHFGTKLDLLRQSLSGPLGGLASIVGAREPPPTLVPLLTHMRHSQALGRELFLPRTRLSVRRVLAQHIEARLNDVARTRPQAQPIIPLGLIALHMAEAQLALVEEWSLGRTACGVEQVAAALCASSHATTAALLRLEGAL